MSRGAIAIALAAACLGLGGCSTLLPRRNPAPSVDVAPPPPVRARAKPRPAPPPVVEKSSCVPRSVPRAPRYPDTDQALRDAGGAADRYQLLAAGRILRSERLAALERIVEGCR